MFTEEAESLQKTIERYFDGIFYGDVSKLRGIFHPKAILVGDISDEPYFKEVNEYLHIVAGRKSPKEMGEEKRMKIVSLEVLNNIAYAKLHVPMFDFNYYDYLALSKNKGAWQIVNKLFTHY